MTIIISAILVIAILFVLHRGKNSNIVTYGAFAFFVFLLITLFVIHPLSLQKGAKVSSAPSERIMQLQNELKEQQETYHRYAPIAQQARIAERHMTLANQKANTIREELAILEGFQEGAQ